MFDRVSQRVTDQRLRNLIIGSVQLLSLGDEAVTQVGSGEYFEWFYDLIPHRDDGNMHANSAISLEEYEGLKKLSAMLDDACDATAGNVTIEELIKSGWPKRIEPLARQVHELMELRGRFTQTEEEWEPPQRS